MNKRGDIATVFFALYFATISAVFVSSYFLRYDHRDRQAVEFCQELGGVNCEARVEAMTDEQVLDYIRDDDLSSGNRGNFAGGYMN